jgi:ABC-2 type transport system permease protein
VKTFSGGMRRRLDLAASLVGEPPVLFLDEPTTGLDPQGRNELWGLLTELVDGGTTLVLTTQYLEEADRLADAIAVLDRGRVVANGSPAELKARVGGERIAVTLAAERDLAGAAAALRAFADGPPRTDTDPRARPGGRRRDRRPPPRGHPRRRVPHAHRRPATGGRGEHRGDRLMDAITAERAPITERLRWQLSDSIVLARRNVSHVRQIPEKLIDVTVQPLMFVLLFAYVFGGVIHVPGGSYREYLLGGILVQTLTFGIIGPATSIATDLTEGIVDRFRSLPMSRSAFLLGHLISDLASSTLALAIMSISGLIVGWRVHSDVLHALGGFALLGLFALTMLWLGMLLGLLARTPDAVTGVAFIVVFPLTFIANTFVPAGGLPDGLRQVAEYNPISALSAAVRTLFGNPTALPRSAAWPLEHPVLSAVAWCLIALALVVPLTIARYRARTTG